MQFGRVGQGALPQHLDHERLPLGYPLALRIHRRQPLSLTGIPANLLQQKCFAKYETLTQVPNEFKLPAIYFVVVRLGLLLFIDSKLYHVCRALS